MRPAPLILALLLAAPAAATDAVPPRKVGFHPAVYDAEGRLVPWTSWRDAVDREMAWYLACPTDPHGYPVFVFTTFMNGRYKPTKTEIIPATQNGMGILSYLKYWEFTGRTNPKVLAWARKMGDYLVNESLTPDQGPWRRFTRSTGDHRDFPLARSSQGDAQFGPHVIEPDKGGIAGYALLRLFEATGDRRYLRQAHRNARRLAQNMRTGDATRAPWPFRVDAVSGAHWGERNANMVYILRLFDGLLARGHERFRAPREALWTWIKQFQLPSGDDRNSSLWVQFFEDHVEEDNRNSWAPLETARYLIEQKDRLDPDWRADAERLIDFAVKHFSAPGPGGVVALGEQDADRRLWGGVCSKLGGVAALFYAAGGGERYRRLAHDNLTWVMYHIDTDGCPTDETGDPGLKRGGWQEDCHTDVLHNFVDAFAAVPEWGRGEADTRVNVR